jgi:hypothetical protein
MGFPSKESLKTGGLLTAKFLNPIEDELHLSVPESRVVGTLHCFPEHEKSAVWSNIEEETRQVSGSLRRGDPEAKPLGCR